MVSQNFRLPAARKIGGNPLFGGTELTQIFRVSEFFGGTELAWKKSSEFGWWYRVEGGSLLSIRYLGNW